MNKSFYIFLNALLVLALAAALLQNIIYLQLGAKIYLLSSFVPWFVAVNAVSFTVSLSLLSYYQYKKYWFAFVAGAISLIAMICYAAVTYHALVWRQNGGLYIPALLFALVAAILYGLSLMFSNSGRRSWLKASGTYGFIVGLVLLSAVIWALISPNHIAQSITEWASFMSSLSLLLFIMHFRTEIKLLAEQEEEVPVRQSVAVVWSFLGLLLFVLTIFFGIQLATENSSSAYWGRQNFEKTKQLARLFDAHTFVNRKGDTLLYRLLKPLNFDPKQKYPLVVCLPYGGQPGTDKIRQLEGAAAAQLLSTNQNRKKYPAFIFVPNCPAGSGWGGIPNYPAVDSLVYEAITALDDTPGIDIKRQYVTGISRGGYGAWTFISKRPDLFAAAIPVCGGGDPKLAPNAAKVAVWAFHGEDDHNVPVSGSRDMIAAMKKAGGNPKYTEFANQGHNIWYKVSVTPGLWDWLFAQKRE